MCCQMKQHKTTCKAVLLIKTNLNLIKPLGSIVIFTGEERDVFSDTTEMQRINWKTLKENLLRHIKK